MAFLYVTQHSYVSLLKDSQKLHFPRISVTQSSQMESARKIHSQENK